MQGGTEAKAVLLLLITCLGCDVVVAELDFSAESYLIPPTHPTISFFRIWSIVESLFPNVTPLYPWQAQGSLVAVNSGRFRGPSYWLKRGLVCIFLPFEFITLRSIFCPFNSQRCWLWQNTVSTVWIHPQWYTLIGNTKAALCAPWQSTLSRPASKALDVTTPHHTHTLISLFMTATMRPAMKVNIWLAWENVFHTINPIVPEKLDSVQNGGEKWEIIYYILFSCIGWWEASTKGMNIKFIFVYPVTLRILVK